MGEGNVNTDTKESERKIKNPKEVKTVVKEMEKIINTNKYSIIWLAYWQGKLLEKFKANDKFINLVNQFAASKSKMVFQNFLCDNFKQFS